MTTLKRITEEQRRELVRLERPLRAAWDTGVYWLDLGDDINRHLRDAERSAEKAFFAIRRRILRNGEIAAGEELE